MPAKINIYRSYGEKLISLFARLLFSGESHSLTDLARMLHCSKQTVLRLLDDIRMAYGVDIEETFKGNRKYFRIKKRRRAPSAFCLTEMELNVLYMCQAFAEHLLGRRQFEEATRALLKSRSLLPEDGLLGCPQHFASFRPGTIDYSPHQEGICSLIEAMEEKRICKVTYKALGGGKAKTFYIKPLKIFSHKDTVYVHARLARAPGKPYREPDYDPLLAIHRFQKVEQTERFFEFPADYDFEKAFNREFGVIKEDAFRVEVEFTGWAARYVSERIWSPDQKIVNKGDGRVRLSFTASSKPEIGSWILSFQNDARVLKPQWLVQEVEETIGEMHQNYTGSP